MSVSAPPGIQINWYQGQNSIGSGNPFNITAPSSSTTYLAEPVSNCSNPVNVTVITNGSVVINGPANNCSGDVLEYSIGNPYDGVFYNWNVTGGQLTSSNTNGTSVTITWDSQNWQDGGTLTVWSDNLNCLDTAIFHITECCFVAQANVLAIDGSSDNDFTTDNIYLSEVFQTTSSFTVSPGFFLGFNSYQTLLLGGNVIVDIDFTITNGITVNLLPGARIEVISGKTLTIDNLSVLKAACDKMWGSINVFGELIVNNGAVIQDAETGTISLGNAILNIGASGNKVEYNKNHIGIALWGHNSPGDVQIRNTKFTCRASNTTQNNDELISPYAGEHSAVGVYLYFSPAMINIGRNRYGMHNIFDNLDFGILSIQSQFNAINNQFMHILNSPSTFDCDCDCPKGTAICADGRGKNGLIANIGNMQPFQSNDFRYNDYGIYITENMSSSVINNDFLETNYNAMTFNNNINGFYEVYDNTSKGVGKSGTHIYMYNNPKTFIKEIMRNEINESYNPTHLYATGIAIHEVSNAPATVRILDNDIYNVRTGIYTLGANNVEINDNEIQLNAQPDGEYGAGIIANVGKHYSILNNTISADNRNNWWVDGIRLEYITHSTVNCNLMQRTASGLFINGDCNNTFLMQNNLRRNYCGYIINNAITGLQQTGFYSDNIWTGPYDNNTFTGSGTYWHTSNMQGSNPFDNALNVRPYTGAGNVYKPNPFYAEGLFNTELQPNVNPLVGPIYYPNGLNNHSGCNLDTTAGAESLMMQQIIAGTYESTEYNEETKWWLKYQLYEKLNEDSSLNYNNNMLVQFTDSMSHAPAGKLLEVQHAAADTVNSSVDALISLKSFNSGITTYNPLENDYKLINDRILQAMIEDRDTLLQDYTFTTNEIAEIKAVAEKCPFEYGPAVYLARALYGRIIKECKLFLNPCETANPFPNSGARIAPTVYPYIYDPTEELDMQKLEITDNPSHDWLVSIFPNPANEMLYIESEKAIQRIELCDVMGKTVYSVQGNGSLTMNIPVSDFAKGIYLVRVYDQSNSFTTRKLSIAH